MARTIAQKLERFLEGYRQSDGSRWGGQDLHDATGGVVTMNFPLNARRVERGG